MPLLISLMIKHLNLINLGFLLALGLTAVTPGRGAVLAASAVRNGFYWQKTQGNSGSIRYLCRSTNSSKFQKHQRCRDAGLKKPN